MGPYGFTMKGKAEKWIKDHLDGCRYSVKEIGYEAGANPTAVRAAIHELQANKAVHVRKSGNGKATRWQFWPRLWQK